MERVNVVIAGGGIIGSAVAWSLAERGVRDIHVIDLDLAGIYASSELNAGGVRATWWQPVNIETCRQSLDFFRTLNGVRHLASRASHGTGSAFQVMRRLCVGLRFPWHAPPGS